MDEAAGAGTGVRWGATFVLGLLILALGALALSASFWTGMASIVFLGFLIVASGLVEIGQWLRTRKGGRPVGHLLSGVLAVVIGVLLVARPVAGLAGATLLLIGFFFTSGLFRSIGALFDRYTFWGWDLAYGICTIVLGVVLLAQWPASALLLVGTLVGLEIMFRGAALMAGSLNLRQLQRRQERAV